MSIFVRGILIGIATCGFVSALCIAAPPITSLAFSPDGKTALAASEGQIATYAWPSLERLGSSKVKFDKVTDLRFSAAGERLLTIGGAPGEFGGFQIIDWPRAEQALSGNASQRHEVSPDAIFAAVWIDKQRVALACAEGTVLIVSTDGEIAHTLNGHSRHVLSVAALAGGKILVSGGADASVRVWDIESGKLLRTLGNHTSAVRALAVRPTGEGLPMIASAGADKTVRLWQPTIGRMVRFARLKSPPLSIAWSLDGKRLLASCEDGRLRVINPDTVAILQDEPAINGWAFAVAVSPDGRSCVVAGEGGKLTRIALNSAQSEK